MTFHWKCRRILRENALELPTTNVNAHERLSIDGRWTSKGLTVKKTVKQEVKVTV